jgi:hypothetical protein
VGAGWAEPSGSASVVQMYRVTFPPTGSPVPEALQKLQHPFCKVNNVEGGEPGRYQ